MQHISFEALVSKAMELKQAGLKWHFHMIGPACKFSRLKDQYEIIIEIESSGEVYSACFCEKPIAQTRQMAELAYGPGFLTKEAAPEKAISADAPIDKSAAFQKILDRARSCCSSGTAWHNHHLFPDCNLNPQRGRHCIVFEDEKSGDALYAYYDHDPVKDLSELEALFFAE